MTTPEHTLVGIHLAIAAGCHRWAGWPLVGLAAVASNMPDLDGLPMLIDIQRFEQLHRVLFHNFLAIALTSIVLACSEAYWGWISRLTGWLMMKFATPVTSSQSLKAEHSRMHAWRIGLFFVTSFFAQAAHLRYGRQRWIRVKRLACITFLAILRSRLRLRIDSLGRHRPYVDFDGRNDWDGQTQERIVTHRVDYTINTSHLRACSRVDARSYCILS